MQWCTVLLAVLLTACSANRHEDLRRAHQQTEAAFRRGDMAEALAEADRGLSGLSKDDGGAAAWRLRLLRGEIEIARRNFDASRSAIETAIPDMPEAGSLRGHQQYLRARLALATNDLPGAQDALARARALAAADQELALDAALQEGQIAIRQQRWGDATRGLTAAFDRALRLNDRYRQLQLLNNLGVGALYQARYDEALSWLERALGYSEFEDTTVYGTVLSNAGICYSRLGLFDRATSTQRRAVEIHRQRKVAPSLQLSLGSLGVTHGLRGNDREALPFLQEAFDLAKELQSPADAARWANNLAAAHARLGEWDRAEYYNEQSRALGKGATDVREVYNTLVAADIALARQDAAGAARLYEEALASPDVVPAVRWSAEAGLANAALAARQPDRAARYFESALATLEQTRSDLLKTDYKLSFLTQLIEFYQSYVDALVAQGRSERALEIADSSRGRVLAERQRVNAPTRTPAAAFRQVAGRTRTVLLSYWLAPRRSFLWIVSGAGIRRVDLPPASEIEALVREYRAMVDNSLADPLARPGTPGDRLYQLLVAPAQVPRGASVIIVPDGALHGVNFETLPVDGPDRRYWIEDAELQIAPALSMLRATGRDAGGMAELLLIGNPTPRLPEFPALSYAPAEMTSIVRHFPRERVTAYESARATPAVYQEAPVDRYQMIHFTAHATANLESPLDSAVVLSGPDGAFKLYARDVAEKALKAELVTVSACRSAGERAYSGEGLVGFAWAFLRAGARRVIAGLWDVDDRSTARLMDDLYANLQRGESPASALRRAKLALIRSGNQLARPYYWGPFQLYTTAL
ncbi:MAG: CHAT domain-containing protein [Vicinamibacterales bacterium]